MIQNDNPCGRLIFALDLSEDFAGIMAWVRRLKDRVGMFKVGKELFTRFGPPIVEAIKNEGAEVFLDLKFHDIPSTVAHAAEGAVRLGVRMFNVHALGGEEMMRAAVHTASQRANESGQSAPIVLAVTVLTSLSEGDLAEIGFSLRVPDLVSRLAILAKKAGIHGVVCSPQEIGLLRPQVGDDFFIVTPGVRGGNSVPGDDQKRTLSAREAIAAGADYLVVGRPIRWAPNPEAAADALAAEIGKGLEDRKQCQPSTA
ncbi:MAG: orotidine-5'-phosphate decarboxylase [Syntrophales bacterium]|nr:orotidine-5'-phosphate decarboxylase [Syntrophales bacterium]